MRKVLTLKFLTCFILIALVTVVIHSVHENAHVMKIDNYFSSVQKTQPILSESSQCPCSPQEQHADFDGCKTCSNCSCHAPLSIQPKQLNYNPFILDLHAYEPFKYLPEVHLPKFIPPEIHS